MVSGKILHYEMLDKLGEGGKYQNGPRVRLRASGARLEDPPKRSAGGGEP